MIMRILATIGTICAGGASGSRQQEEPRESMTDADGFMNIPDGIDEELPFA